MKKGMLYLVLLYTINRLLPIVHAEEDGFIMDMEAINNESYEGIRGDYKYVNFFSSEIIKKIQYYESKEKDTYVAIQNVILEKKQIDRTMMYHEIQNSFFEEPLGVLKKTIDEKQVHNTTDITMGLFSMIIVLLFTYIYYEKKMERRLLEYDENNALYL